jgi:hypothetical protein
MDFVVGQKFIGRLTRGIYTITSVNPKRGTIALSKGNNQCMDLAIISLRACIDDGTLQPLPKVQPKITTTRKK